MSECLRVVVRPRPSRLGYQVEQYEPIIKLDNHTHLRLLSERPQHFDFDRIFSYDTVQSDVFLYVGRDIVFSAVHKGINGTIFAYGQTCSGKTHTMLGPSDKEDCFSDLELRGIIPRCADFLFEQLEIKDTELGENFKWWVNCAFVELYNEEYFDLLDDNKKVKPRNGANGVYLEGLTDMACESSGDVLRVLQRGWDNRRVAETNMNRTSSRSHALFIVDLVLEEMGDDGVVVKKTSRINMVDLAGSERIAQTGAEGERLKEACKINKSLSVLSRVIRELSEKRNKGKHIPYRDSALTYFLKDSIGGNAKTAVVVCVHTEPQYFAYTQSSLRFAAQCRLVKNSIHANEIYAGDSVLALQNRVKRISMQLENATEKERERINHEELEPLRERVEQLDNWRRLCQEMREENERLKLKLRISRNFGKELLDDLVADINIDKKIDEVLEGNVFHTNGTDVQTLIDKNEKNSSRVIIPMRRNSYLDSSINKKGRASELNSARSPSRKEHPRTMYTPAEKVRESLAARKRLDFEGDTEENTVRNEFAHLELAEQELENTIKENSAKRAELEDELAKALKENALLHCENLKAQTALEEKSAELHATLETISCMAQQNVRETMDHVHRIDFLQSANQKLKNRLEEVEIEKRKILKALENEKKENELKDKEIDLLSKENRRADEELTALAGHANQNQKVRMMDRYRNEVMQLKKENFQLVSKLGAAQNEVRMLSTKKNKEEVVHEKRMPTLPRTTRFTTSSQQIATTKATKTTRAVAK